MIAVNPRKDPSFEVSSARNQHFVRSLCFPISRFQAAVALAALGELRRELRPGIKLRTRRQRGTGIELKCGSAQFKALKISLTAYVVDSPSAEQLSLYIGRAEGPHQPAIAAPE
jgi:hypothetical protein